ncbi:MAG: protein translocase subunit SecF [Patescibacteria group bacterium]
MKLMRFKNIYFAISLLFLVPGIISLAVFGLKPSIDFTGGSLMELKINDFDSEINLEDLIEISSVQKSGENQYLIRSSEISNEEKDQVLEKLSENYEEVEELRFETVGPTLGRELLEKTLTAVVLVAGLITLYVWKQFDEIKYGICAILAMFHDSLILLGTFSLLGHFYGIEVDVLFVTALLTTLSFSIHDTIVVYDRIRELRREHKKQSFQSVVDAAVIQTLSRSINNSVTIIVMLLALAFLGGETIRWFAIALLIGAVTGTYSSTFTAAPLLLLWDEIKLKIKK